MKRTCCNCGEPIDDGMAFCRKCGTRVAESPPGTPKQMPTEETQAPSAEAKTKKTSEKKPTTTKEKVIGAIQGVIGLIVIAGLIAGLIALGSWLFQSCSSNSDISRLEKEAESLFIQVCERDGIDTDAFTVEDVDLIESKKGSDLYKGTVELRMKDGKIEEAEVEVTYHNNVVSLKLKNFPPTLLKKSAEKLLIKSAEKLLIQFCERTGIDADTFTVENMNLVESKKGNGLYKGTVKLRMEDGDIESAEMEVTIDKNSFIFMTIKKLPPTFLEKAAELLFIQSCEEYDIDTDTFIVEDVNLAESKERPDLYEGTVELRMEDGDVESVEVEVTVNDQDFYLEIIDWIVFLEKSVETLFVQICEESGVDTDTFTVEDVILVESGKDSGLYKGIVKLRMEDGDVESAMVEVTDDYDGTSIEIITWPTSF